MYKDRAVGCRLTKFHIFDDKPHGRDHLRVVRNGLGGTTSVWSAKKVCQGSKVTGTVKAGAVFASASDSGRGGARPSRLELLVFSSQSGNFWQYEQFIEPGLRYLIGRSEQRADDCAAMAIIATAGCIG